MSFFDKLKQQAAQSLGQTMKQAVDSMGNRTYTVTLRQLPVNLTQLQAMLKDTNVTSPVNGTVKSVRSDNDPYGYSESAFITIMEAGEFLVKGTVNELNMWQLQEGMPVTVRSRVDDTVWTGVLQRIDTSAPVEDNNNYYYGGSEELQSSKYNFYVALDSNEGLFVGQHVTVEMGGEAAAQSGLWVSGMFICDADTAPYVWKDSNGRLVKQSVELGAFNDMTYEYEVLSGLCADDDVAFPAEELREGMRTTTEYAEPDMEAGAVDAEVFAG